MGTEEKDGEKQLSQLRAEGTQFSPLRATAEHRALDLPCSGKHRSQEYFEGTASILSRFRFVLSGFL